MDREGYRKYLEGRKVAEDKIDAYVGIVERFEKFLKDNSMGVLKMPTSEDINAFSVLLIQEKLNTFDNFLALARYGQFLKNYEVYLAVVQLVDGAEAMDTLYDKLGKEIGEQLRDEIFEGVELPPMGTISQKKHPVTQTVMRRLEDKVPPETCKKILSSGLRDLRDEWYLEERKKFQECGSLDEYLKRKGKDFIAELEQIMNEGRLYFNQEITQEVIDFVRNTPEIMQGVREGNILYEIKIPYMAKEYLAETDERLKRYYYCHCPWVRESLRVGETPVSSTFCHCSAGFHKKPYDVIFDQPLNAEAVESVLKGDPWCKIAIYLPEGV